MLGSTAKRLVELAEALERRGDDYSWSELRRFGEALAVVGGVQALTRVFDEAVDRHGWRAVPGVADCWNGIEGWRP